MQAVKCGLKRGAQHALLYRLGIVSQRRFVFGFSPTSTPDGLQNYELLYRDYQKESNDALNMLKQNGYLDIISLRNIDDYPLNERELKDLRYKLDLQYHLWIDPPLWEDNKSPSFIDEIAQKIVNGYNTNKKKGKNIHDRLYGSKDDEYRVITPIFYHKKEQRAIIALPADKLITIIKPSKKEVEHSYYGDEDKRYQVLGTQWHKKGAKFYDKDDGMDWDHVKFENAEESQEKTFRNWKDWGDLEYIDQNAKNDPNDMDSFFYRTPKEDHKKRRPSH